MASRRPRYCGRGIASAGPRRDWS